MTALPANAVVSERKSVDEAARFLPGRWVLMTVSSSLPLRIADGRGESVVPAPRARSTINMTIGEHPRVFETGVALSGLRRS